MRKSKIPRLAMALFFCLSVFLLSGSNQFAGVLADTADSSGVSAPVIGDADDGAAGGASPDGSASGIAYTTSLHNGGVYYIRNMRSGLYMDATGGGTTAGTLIQQWTFNGTPSQQWELLTYADGSCRLIGIKSRLYVDVQYQSTADGVKFDLWGGDCTTEYFKFGSNGNGSFRIVTKGSGYTKYAVVQGASTSPGAKVIQYSFNATQNDEWFFEPVPLSAAGASGVKPSLNLQKQMYYVISGRTYYIRNKHSGLYLDAINGGTTDGTYLQQYGFNGTPSQQWQLLAYKKPDSSGTVMYRLMGAKSRKYVALQKNVATNQTRIGLWGGDLAQQRFYLGSSTTKDGSCTMLTPVSGKKSGAVVQDASLSPGAYVFEYTYNTSGNDEWVFEPTATQEMVPGLRWCHMSSLSGVPRCDIRLNADYLTGKWANDDVVNKAKNNWNNNSGGKVSIVPTTRSYSNVDLELGSGAWATVYGNDMIALTTIWDKSWKYWDGGATPDSVDASALGDRITYARILFNPDYANGNVMAPLSWTDRTKTIAHEIGHCMNMGHQIAFPSVVPSLMAYDISLQKGTPQTADLNTLKAMYNQLYS